MSDAWQLVTGGAGFIGSNLVRALVAAGHRVRVLDDLSTGTWSNLDGLDGVERHAGDVRDAEAVARAMAGVDVVFHLAALGSVPLSIERPVHADAVNVGGTITVLEAARQAGVRRVVFAASSAAYGDDPTLPKVETMAHRPLSPYAVGKVAGEHYLRVYAELHGMDAVSLRYFNIFGPGQRPDGAYAAAIPRFIWRALAGEAIEIYGDGGATRDFCFVDNAVAANLAAAQASRRFSGDVINVASGESVCLNDLLVELAQQLDRPLEIRHSDPRQGDVRHSSASIDRARELLGYSPGVSWKAGLQPTIEYLTRLLKSSASGRAPGPPTAKR